MNHIDRELARVFSGWDRRPMKPQPIEPDLSDDDVRPGELPALPLSEDE